MLLITSYKFPLSLCWHRTVFFSPLSPCSLIVWFCRRLYNEKSLSWIHLNSSCTFPHTSNFKTIFFSSPPESPSQMLMIPSYSTRSSMSSNWAENPFNHALHILLPPLHILLLLSSYISIPNYYSFPLWHTVFHQLLKVHWQNINHR